MSTNTSVSVLDELGGLRVGNCLHFGRLRVPQVLSHTLIFVIVTRVDGVYNTMFQYRSHILRLILTLTNSLNFFFMLELRRHPLV
jgi:hypothetical protein